jgi:hypothetical protein
MDTAPEKQTATEDNKTLPIIITIGVIFVVCICCLLTVAGYYLYKDLKLSPTSTPVPSPEVLLETPIAVSDAPVFQDQFDSNANEWTVGTYEDEYGKTDFEINGTYSWDVSAAKGVNQKSWASKAPSVQDFIASVDATHPSGKDNAAFGILFRVQNTNNLYYFAISDVGYYYTGLLQDGKWTTLIDWTETSYIHPGQQNSIKVKGIGDELTFYINDNAVDRIQDSTFTQGTAGLAIELYDAGNQSTFVFDNFLISNP